MRLIPLFLVDSEVAVPVVFVEPFQPGFRLRNNVTISLTSDLDLLDNKVEVHHRHIAIIVQGHHPQFQGAVSVHEDDLRRMWNPRLRWQRAVDTLCHLPGTVVTL